MEKQRIAVLIPCYNESRTVAKVVKDFRKALPEADIYVYDNNSTDSTDEIARAAGAIVRYEYKQGKGNVIRAMFRDVDADCYIMTDGDDTYPAENAREMCDLIFAGKADMVNGDRLSSTYFQENKRMFHNSGNVLVRRLINRLFHSKRCAEMWQRRWNPPDWYISMRRRINLHIKTLMIFVMNRGN